jgi:hypothetical protein
VDILLFKVNIHPQSFQFPDGLEQGQRIPGEARDAFGDYQVNLPGPAIGKQLLELISVVPSAG